MPKFQHKADPETLRMIAATVSVGVELIRQSAIAQQALTNGEDIPQDILDDMKLAVDDFQLGLGRYSERVLRRDAP